MLLHAATQIAFEGFAWRKHPRPLFASTAIEGGILGHDEEIRKVLTTFAWNGCDGV